MSKTGKRIIQELRALVRKFARNEAIVVTDFSGRKPRRRKITPAELRRRIASEDIVD